MSGREDMVQEFLCLPILKFEKIGLPTTADQEHGNWEKRVRNQLRTSIKKDVDSLTEGKEGEV